MKNAVMSSLMVVLAAMNSGLAKADDCGIGKVNAQNIQRIDKAYQAYLENPSRVFGQEIRGIVEVGAFENNFEALMLSGYLENNSENFKSAVRWYMEGVAMYSYLNVGFDMKAKNIRKSADAIAILNLCSGDEDCQYNVGVNKARKKDKEAITSGKALINELIEMVNKTTTADMREEADEIRDDLISSFKSCENSDSEEVEDNAQEDSSDE